MVFSSILFLFRFLPIALAVYFLVPRRFKNAALFILSLLFYSWGEVRYFPIMIASTVVDYAMSQGIERHRGNKTACRWFLTGSVLFNLGSLLFFKYTNFIVSNLNTLLGTQLGMLSLSLPLGISFYTFQTMSYTIDVYRGKVQAENNFIDFGTFVTLFPQLIAGPIVKYTDINKELKSRTFHPARMQESVLLFIMGLGSKVLIANNIGSLWTQIEQMGYTGISTPLAWLGILAFALQIYFDFSGYSLMAIGLGGILGFSFPRNFDYPYISKSATEFWRRWHMTLGGWFREYVYIPLGGNRKGLARQYLNIFIVWGLTGLWHGASWNFVLWGLFFCLLLCIEKSFLLPYLEGSKVLSRIYILFLILISWVLFAITDFGQMTLFLSRLFVWQGGDDWIYYIRNYGVTFVLGILLSMPVLRKLRDKLPANGVVVWGFAGVVLLISVAYLVDSTYNPFLYFRF